MGKTLDSFQFTDARVRHKAYPWIRWADGQIWRAEKGVDFDVSPKSFRNTVWRASYDLAMDVKTAIEGDAVVFQFSQREVASGPTT